ncbi:hypothetical protein O0L34_g17613 [Tuta absoluta]|nr:hypothetical protein O0L34_g17613 [Tuta absoluta]
METPKLNTISSPRDANNALQYFKLNHMNDQVHSESVPDIHHGVTKPRISRQWLARAHGTDAPGTRDARERRSRRCLEIVPIFPPNCALCYAKRASAVCGRTIARLCPAPVPV